MDVDRLLASRASAQAEAEEADAAAAQALETGHAEVWLLSSLSLHVELQSSSRASVAWHALLAPTHSILNKAAASSWQPMCWVLSAAAA
jgi:hypothetical protein